MALRSVPSRGALEYLFSALADVDTIRLAEPSLGYTVSQSQAKENIIHNRWRDIVAYDHALLPGPYLNAAYVPPFHPSSLSFIVSQAPLPDTFSDFYQALVRQKVKVLVNLTALMDGARVKSDQYWPTSSDQALQLTDGCKVTLIDEQKISLNGQSSVIKRALLIHSNNSDWTVYQFHLSAWPDHGTFPTDLLLSLMDELYKVPTTKMFPPAPMWIHCSAGVGRSGTLAAGLIAQTVVNNYAAHNASGSQASDQVVHMAVDIWDLPLRIVEHLRRYRPRMVERLEQFEAVYQLVDALASRVGL